MIKKIAFYANFSKDGTEENLNQLLKMFQSGGFGCSVLCETPTVGDFDCDLVIALGGDGTVLNIVDCLAAVDKPLLAVNTGTLGFLSCFESGETDAIFRMVSDGKFTVSNRILLNVECGGEHYLALNDGVVERISTESGYSQPVRIKLCLNGAYVDGYSADGLIISTPTGSTAYSLSAGGAILSPDLNVLIATPVCAHSLRSKPVVFSGDDVAAVTLMSGSAGLIIDGKFKKRLDVNQSAVFSKSDKSIKIIDKNKNFYGKLYNKLNKWGSGE